MEEIVLIAGALVAAYFLMQPKAPACSSQTQQQHAQGFDGGPTMKPPAFGVASNANLHTCIPVQSVVPLVTPSIADSTVGGVDLFAASGGTTPTAAGGDRLINTFVGSDGVTQYSYMRANGNTYTTTVKNP